MDLPDFPGKRAAGNGGLFFAGRPHYFRLNVFEHQTG
jgi:hypothetical protein